MINYWNWDAAVEDLQRAKTATTHHHVPMCRSDVELHWRVDQQIEFLTSDEECQISFSMLQYMIDIDK